MSHFLSAGTSPPRQVRAVDPQRKREAEEKGREERRGGRVVKLGEGWHGRVGEEEGEMKKRKERERNYRRGMKEK